MSFEGRVEYICENGHITSVDVYIDHKGRIPCPNCSGQLLYWALVDETNDDDKSTAISTQEGFIPGDDWHTVKPLEPS